MDILTTVLGVIVGLLILVFLVVIHELGHAVFARRNGVVVEEFGIGFPPKAWGKRLKNGVLFTVNWLPLGGFVKMQGENDSADKPGDYGAASLWQKTKILLAGVAVNWIAAVIIFTILYLVGMPKVLDNQFSIPSDTRTTGAAVTIASVQKNSPAQQAGLKAGDEVKSLDGQTLDSTASFISFTKAHQGKKVVIDYVRDGKEATVDATLRQGSAASQGALGAGIGQAQSLHSTWSAPISGIVVTGQFTVATFVGLGALFGNLGHGNFAAAGDSVAGPVGILGTIFPAALKGGPITLLYISGIISLTLAVMNTLPIPALDGGRWFVTFLFRVLRKPLPKDLEERIHGTGFMILLALVALITVLDVGKLFK